VGFPGSCIIAQLVIEEVEEKIITIYPKNFDVYEM